MIAAGNLRALCANGHIEELMDEARAISWRHFGKSIELYYSYYQDKADKLQFTKDARERYKHEFIQGIKDSMVNLPPVINLSGNRCELSCDHCKKINLRAMLNADTPEKLYTLVKEFHSNGAQGFLLSAGSRIDGTTIIEPVFDKTIMRIKRDFGSYLGIHAGYISRTRVREIKELGVDSILVDVIGHEDTLRQVYHLERPLSVIEDVIRYAIEEKIDVIPHICIGLHYGRIIGEYDAIDMLAKYPLKNITFIILEPTPGTPMADVIPPDAESVSRLLVYSRFKLPKVLHALGCIRPIGSYGEKIELAAIQAGCNRIAGISSDLTISRCMAYGLNYNIGSHCCMIGNGMFNTK